MSNQLDRFINTTSENYSNLITLWQNVQKKEINGERNIDVSSGIDLKRSRKKTLVGGLNANDAQKEENKEEKSEDESEKGGK